MRCLKKAGLEEGVGSALAVVLALVFVVTSRWSKSKSKSIAAVSATETAIGSSNVCVVAAAGALTAVVVAAWVSQELLRPGLGPM